MGPGVSEPYWHISPLVPMIGRCLSNVSVKVKSAVLRSHMAEVDLDSGTNMQRRIMLPRLECNVFLHATQQGNIIITRYKTTFVVVLTRQFIQMYISSVAMRPDLSATAQKLFSLPIEV
jgi:hypothetical protein